MDAFLHQLRATLRLHFRNRMALIYSYLFPTIFLIAFWVLYRYDRVPLVRHMGELLTVTALGGACFGLPTTMVSERERGVWRRYRLAPVPTGTLLAGAVVARYLLLVVAGLLQVVLAMAIGMPMPDKPIDLWVAFTFVAFALLGLGLVIATLADNVPAVQALGQCIFLPMLIIGGVAVQLASLPEWAQHVSAFFPGRYAVEAIQTSVTGDGVRAAGFSLLALFLIGLAGSLAGAKLFRWDAQQRFVQREGKAWVAVALAAWVAVGLLAEAQGRIGPVEMSARARPVAADAAVQSPPGAVEPPAPSPPAAGPSPQPTPPPAPEAPASETRTPIAGDPARPAEKPAASGAKPATPGQPGGAAAPPSAPPPSSPSGRGQEPPRTSPAEPNAWQDVTPAHIEEVMFERLPSDAGVISPIARADEPLEADLEAEVEEVRTRLPAWRPALVTDPVQKVRNVLYVAAVADVFQLPIERHLPHVVFERLQADVPKEDLIKILFWIATHPTGGDDSAVDELPAVGLRLSGPDDMQQARERVMLYALKLLGRLSGKIPS